MNLYDKIAGGEEKISVVGLGYVGMPIAVSFAKKAKVIGFDLNRSKIKQYKNGIDPTREVGDEAIKATTASSQMMRLSLRKQNFILLPCRLLLMPIKPRSLSCRGCQQNCRQKFAKRFDCSLRVNCLSGSYRKGFVFRYLNVNRDLNAELILKLDIHLKGLIPGTNIIVLRI